MVWCGYLGWLSLRDIRKRAIPLWMLSAGGLPVLLGLLRNGWNVSVITALLPGALILYIVCTDRYGWQGGRHYSDAAGQCLHGWKDMASALLEPYLYFFVFYDSLYIYKRSEKTYSIYSIFADSVYNDMDYIEREWK